jgi:hypothetical protein
MCLWAISGVSLDFLLPSFPSVYSGNIILCLDATPGSYFLSSLLGLAVLSLSLSL